VSQKEAILMDFSSQSGMMLATSRHGQAVFFEGELAVQYSRIIGPRQKRVCPSASHSGLSGGTGFLFFPPVIEPANSNHGGSMMLLRIESYFEDDNRPGRNEEGYCDTCGGVFYDVGRHFGLYDLEADADDDLHGLFMILCYGCATLEPDKFRRQLEIIGGEHEERKYFKTQDAEIWRSVLVSLPENADQDLKDWIQERVQSYEHTAAIEGREAKRFYDMARTAQIEGLNRSVKSKEYGYVYLLGSPDGYCKIGRAKTLTSRLTSIALQLPFKVELLHSIKVSDPVWAERHLHQKFASCRMNGEWFLLSDADINWIKSLTTLEPERA
jgi:hypothetical protein